VASIDVRRRRFRVATLALAIAMLAGAHVVLPFWPVAAPALTAAGVGFAAAGGGIPGLVVAVFGAGLAPFDTPLRVAFAVGAVAVYERASRRDDEVDRVTTQSFTDRLTGLYTYGFLTEALEQEVRRSRRYDEVFSLIVLDLDRFKDFNDRYGHAAGNELLAKVGATITRLKRDSDIAARYGGEELVVVVPGPASHAYALAERIREAVADIGVSAGTGRRTVGTTVSSGIGEFPADGRTPKELFAAADAALYAAKREGRNRVMVASLPEPAIARRAAAG
jgi:diguanylate cyclase (GGDEF)-like protein